MNLRLIAVLAAILQFGISSCTDSQKARAPAIRAGCEASKAVATGTLCVVKASKTDPAISDLFGDHVVGIPASPSKGIWVHLTGTGGKPYYPSYSAGRYLNEVWDSELMGQGYTVLDVAYDNVVSVNASCGDDAGRATNDCAGNIRLEVLTGMNVSLLRDVGVSDSVTHRVEALARYMVEHGLGSSGLFGGWPGVRVSGHSQGAGMAYYLAKNMGVQFACFLAGPYDVADSVPANPRTGIADWYSVPGSKTPISQMGAALASDDSSYRAFTGAYDLIGLTKNREWFEASQTSYKDDRGKTVDGHAAVVYDPSLAPLRAKACFRP